MKKIVKATKVHGSKCRVEGCARKIAVKKHGVCSGHYLRYIRTGKVGSGEIQIKRKLKPIFSD